MNCVLFISYYLAELWVAEGNSIDSSTEARDWSAAGVGEKRTFSVELDPIQYQEDVDNDLTGIYSNFLTIVIR